MKTFIFLLTLISIPASAKAPSLAQVSFEQVVDTGLVFYDQIKSKPLGDFDIMVFRNQALDTLIFGNSENKKILFEDNPGNHLFEKYEVVKVKDIANPVVLTVWTLGVHAHEIRVYDSKLKKLVYSEKSDIEISYQMKDQVLEITQFKELDKAGSPQYQKINWSGKIKK